ncbi:MAG: hypothetical protein AB1349_03165 [Elusimicrobiota bacterium]
MKLKSGCMEKCVGCRIKSFAIACIFFTIAYTLYPIPCLYAAPSGNIQLTIASPDPATAGEKITFQVIALNTGSEKWAADEYYLEAEIYDTQKIYIKKTERVKGKDVNTGETVLVYIPFDVPSSYSGDYFYKITLTLQEQRIIVSEYLTFTIIELAKPPTPEKLPAKISVDGNAILASKLAVKEYKTYGSSVNYTNSLNLNLVGSVYQTPVSLNVYALYTKDNHFDLDNFLFSYYGKSVQVAFGDIQPSYNSLVLYGAGVRGLNLAGMKQRFSTSVVAAESQKKQEGSATTKTNGVYERYTFGGRASQGLDILNSSIGVSYIASLDDKNSIDIPGTTKPTKNNVAGLDGYFELFKNLSIKSEYAQAQYWQDISSQAVKDTGLKSTVSILNIKNFSFTSIYSRISPDFNSLGAPSSTKDKESYEISTGFSRTDIGNVSLYFNNYHDNINKDPSKQTSTQNIGSVSLTFCRTKYPTLTLGYSMNIAKGDPIAALNNETQTPSVAVSHSIKLTTLSISAQRSNFNDKTGISSNLKTDSGNLSISTRLKEKITVATGTTFSKTYNLATSTDTTTTSYSLNLNWLNIIPSKLSAAMWGSYTGSADKPRQSTDNSSMTGTIEFTYNIRQNLAATVGYTRTDYSDKFTETNTYKENSGNIRFSMSF